MSRTGYIITDGVEVVDGKRDDGGRYGDGLAWISMTAQRGSDAFASRESAAAQGTKWGVKWHEVYIKEIHSDASGVWLL